jgi:major type 1 subunit fimbrin (pilin)
MKKLSHTVAMLGVVGACAAPISSFAADGSITFTGAITANTCVVNVNGDTNYARTISLGTMSAAALNDANSAAGRVPVDISLTGCTIPQARANWESVGATDGDNLMNTATSGATNVAVQLLNPSFQPIAVNRNTNNTTPIVFNGGDQTLRYYAQYFSAAGGATAGPVTAITQFSIDYK